MCYLVLKKLLVLSIVQVFNTSHSYLATVYDHQILWPCMEGICGLSVGNLLLSCLVVVHGSMYDIVQCLVVLITSNLWKMYGHSLSWKLHVYSQSIWRRMFHLAYSLIACVKGRWQVGRRMIHWMLLMASMDPKCIPVQRLLFAPLLDKSMLLLLVLYVYFCRGCCCKSRTLLAICRQRPFVLFR